jgi:uncharacterized protein
MILKSEESEYIIGKEISLIYPNDISECIEKDIVVLGNSSDSVGKRVEEEVAAEISDEEIRRALANSKSLVLQLTQDCNFRCKYCSYNGHYKSKRTHQDKKMHFETARKAVDFFLNHVSTAIHRNVREPIIISFYGGEALLEYDMLQRIVRYAEEKNRNNALDVKFLLPSNGLSLTPEKIDQLVKFDFTLDISLDGPEEEHDRFRISVGGGGTHNRIMKNIVYIKNTYREFYENKVKFMVTLHPDHHVKKIEQFFLEHPELFNDRNVRVNYVNITADLDESERVRLRQKSIERNNLIEARLDKNKWFYKVLTLDPIDEKLAFGVQFLEGSTINSFTGACPPGGLKVMVDVDGYLHMCEKISLGYPIGDVHGGFDNNKIRVLITKWRQQILARKCWDCDIRHFCNFCYAINSVSGRIEIREKECHAFKKVMTDRLIRYFTFKEVEDEKKYAAASTVNQFLDLL